MDPEMRDLIISIVITSIMVLAIIGLYVVLNDVIGG